MKAQELLRLYQAGERNFRGQNLQGQSFNRILGAVDFSRTDPQPLDQAVNRSAVAWLCP